MSNLIKCRNHFFLNKINILVLIDFEEDTGTRINHLKLILTLNACIEIKLINLLSSCLWKCNFLAFCSSPPFRHVGFTRYPISRCPLVSHPVYRRKFMCGTVVSSSRSHANLIRKFDCDELFELVKSKKLILG